MKKTFALLLALVMELALVACGQKEDNIGGETKDDQTQTDGQSVDLRAAYDAAIKQVQEELGDNAPVLLEETAVEILNSYYPGLENAKLKQSVFFISPTATSCEVSMVEAESAAGAEIVRQSFQARVTPWPTTPPIPRRPVCGRTTPPLPSTATMWCWRCCPTAAPCPTHFWQNSDFLWRFPFLCAMMV